MEHHEEVREEQAATLPPPASEPGCGKRTTLWCHVFWNTDFGFKLAVLLGCAIGGCLAVAFMLGWAAVNAFLVRIHLLGYLGSNEASTWDEIGFAHVLAQIVFIIIVILAIVVGGKCVNQCEEVQRKVQRLQATPPAEGV